MKIELLPKDLSNQKRIIINYGKVYSIKNKEASKDISVEINGQYHKAEIEE